MAQHVITQRVTVGTNTIGTSVTKTADKGLSASIVIPDDSEDMELDLALPIADLVSLFIYSTRDITIKTNDDATPDDTIELAAGDPYVWYAGHPSPLALSQPVTALFVTNAPGGDAMLSIEALLNFAS